MMQFLRTSKRNIMYAAPTITRLVIIICIICTLSMSIATAHVGKAYGNTYSNDIIKLYNINDKDKTILIGEYNERWQKIEGLRDIGDRKNKLEKINILLHAVEEDKKLLGIKSYTEILKGDPLLQSIFVPILNKRFSSSISVEDLVYWFKYIPSSQNFFWYNYANFLQNKSSKLIDSKKLELLYQCFVKSWIVTKLEVIDDIDIIKSNTIAYCDIEKKIIVLLAKGHYSHAKVLVNYLNKYNKDKWLEYIGFLTVPSKISLYHIKNNGKYRGLQRDLALLALSKYILYKKNDLMQAVKVFSLIKYTPYIEDTYWKVVKNMIRPILKLYQYNVAYNILSSYLTELTNLDHQPVLKQIPSTHLHYIDASYLAGFISIECLKAPKQALKHFKDVYYNVSYITSKSQGAYWLGVSYDQMGDSINAAKFFKIAKSYHGMFYSYIAAKRLNEIITKKTLLDYTTQKQGYHHIDNDIQYAAWLAVILYSSNYIQYAKNVVDYCANYDLNYNDAVRITNYFIQNNLYTLAVRFSKIYCNNGYGLLQTGFPYDKSILPLKYKNNPSLYLALIRQESEFDKKAYNIDGGSGLMQLMPRTASEIAIKLNENYEKNKMDYRYNVKYGVFYIDSLIESLRSTMLSVAAYNAGKKNILSWIKQNHDPRSMHNIHKVACWIELVPFATTRMHIKKVMENYWSYNKLYNKQKFEINF